MGGFGDGVLDALNRAGIHVPLHKVALAEGFVHHGAVDDLRAPAADRRAGHPRPGPRGPRRRRTAAKRRPRRSPPSLLRSATQPLRMATDGADPARPAADRTRPGAARAPRPRRSSMPATWSSTGAARALKPGQLSTADASVSLVEQPRWASRAGAQARARAGRLRDRPDRHGRLDAGASTGGFTDVLLAAARGSSTPSTSAGRS